MVRGPVRRYGDASAVPDGIPLGWNEGFAQAPGVVAASVSDRDGFATYVSAERRTGERDTSEHRLAAGVGTGGCVLQLRRSSRQTVAAPYVRSTAKAAT